MMNKISGVYKITNSITGDCYVGSSRDIKQRLAGHKCVSTWTRCPNSKLYLDMQKYGMASFKFEIIETTSKLKEREQYWIDQLKPSYNDRRANGPDTERQKETDKKWHELYHEEQLAYIKKYHNRLCLYNGETIKLNALSGRFHRQGISNATQEAKKYLLEGEQ